MEKLKDVVVSFEIAKLAKKLNCSHIETFYDYFTNETLWYDIHTGQLNGYSYYGHFSSMLSAPTQSLLQKWLREVHNIDVQPYLILCKNGNGEVKQEKDSKEYAYMVYKDGILKDNYTGVGDFNTYEQALEKGLEEGLKLINNV